MDLKTEIMRVLEYEITYRCNDLDMTDDPDNRTYVEAMEKADKRIIELEAEVKRLRAMYIDLETD